LGTCCHDDTLALAAELAAVTQGAGDT